MNLPTSIGDYSTSLININKFAKELEKVLINKGDLYKKQYFKITKYYYGLMQNASENEKSKIFAFCYGNIKYYIENNKRPQENYNFNHLSEYYTDLFILNKFNYKLMNRFVNNYKSYIKML